MHFLGFYYKLVHGNYEKVVQPGIEPATKEVVLYQKRYLFNYLFLLFI